MLIWYTWFVNEFKAIAFDYGGVIEIIGGENPLEITAGKLDISTDTVSEVYFKYNHLSNAENKTWYEMFDVVLNKLTEDNELKEEIIELIKQNQEKNYLNTELIDLLPDLKENGYKTAIFSNYTTELRERLVDQGIDSLFDKIIISGDIGYQKPDKRAFEILFESLEVEPCEVIFVDDTVKSLETSSEIGYTPILFSNNQKFKQDLERLDVKIT